MAFKIVIVGLVVMNKHALCKKNCIHNSINNIFQLFQLYLKAMSQVQKPIRFFDLHCSSLKPIS